MLFISGAFSIFELTRQSRAVKMMITDSYRSIDYSKKMLEVIDNQEQILLDCIGKNHCTVNGFEELDKIFLQNLDSAKINLTFKNEKLIIDSISIYYNQYSSYSRMMLQSDQRSLEFYLDSVRGIEILTIDQINQLLLLNQEGLYNSAAFHESSGQRAIVPGLIVIITGILFTFIFTYLVNHYFVSPIIKLTKGINDYLKYQKSFDVQLETRDEIFSLKESIKDLISYIRISKKSD